MRRLRGELPRLFAALSCCLLLSCGMSAACSRDEAKVAAKSTKKGEKSDEAAKPAAGGASNAGNLGNANKRNDPATEAKDRARIEALLGKQQQLFDPSKRADPAPTATPTGRGQKGDPSTAKITFGGIARNAKAGAMVVGEKRSYYIGGLNEWPPEFVDGPVVVTGTPQRRKLAPDPVVGANGEVSAGMQGTSAVLDNATWVKPPK